MLLAFVSMLHCACAKIQDCSLRKGPDFLKGRRYAETLKFPSFAFSPLSVLLFPGVSFRKQAVLASDPIGH